MSVNTGISTLAATDTDHMPSQAGDTGQVGFPKPNEATSPTVEAITAAGTMELLAQPKEVKKATRPVNSFMIYRTYYKGIFTKISQKEISPILTFLWQNDTAKNKWAILAKSYSIIRDAQGKPMSPIDVFLHINAPLINVPSPGNYLHAMGWFVCGGDNFRIVQDKDIVDKSFAQTDLSVHDIVQNSIEAGFVQVENLSLRQFDMLMVQADADRHLNKVPMPSHINYTPTGMAPFYAADFTDRCAGTDFDPFACDPFHVYNVSEMFNA